MIAKRQPALLAVWAHPDDEIFHGGILADSRARGARVVIACATAGDAGKVHPVVGRVDDLAALRAEELRQSCRRLGIEPPVLLGFHDSGRNDHQRHDDPRALANVDMIEVEAAIRRVIDEVQPQVILTFDPHGGYYHPDHLAIHRATTAAFFSSGGMGSAAPERLFYGTLRRDVFETFRERSRGRGILDGLDADVFASAPEMIAVAFDARPYVRQKLSAVAAHRSQFGVTDEMIDSPTPDIAAMLDAFGPVLEREVYLVGGTRGPIKQWPLRDFFDGLETSTGPCSL